MTSISDQEATTLVRKYLDNRFINLQLEDEGWLYTSSKLFILPFWNSLFLEILKTSPSGDLSCQLPARDREDSEEIIKLGFKTLIVLFLAGQFFLNSQL